MYGRDRSPRVGIIPARAGFTNMSEDLRRGTGDHPRSRGVYILGGLVEGGDLRIIPARAGFTVTSNRLDAPQEDHPRSRGVYAHENARDHAVLGSSPLARGLPNVSDPYGGPYRIIPARAGFTHVGSGGWRGFQDHPRSRGVYVRSILNVAHVLGSSPLARGLRGDSQNRGENGGIIPARAGFTGRE